MWRKILIGLALVALCGCFKTKDELTLEADGSGVVRLETRVNIPAEMAGMLGAGRMRGGGGMMTYPPTSEDEVKQWFPEKDFQVTARESKADNGETVLNIEARFTNINAVVASPYGRAHALTLSVENGVLKLRGLTGAEAAARFAEMKDDTGMMAAQMPGLKELEKKKEEMRVEFRVTLPNALTAANGTRDGKTATWVVERAKFRDAAEFADKLGLVLEASCPASGMKFSPTNPPHLRLARFSDLKTGTVTEKAVPDATKVAAAAKFTPYALHVTRSLDLSGEGNAGENSAQLIGAVVLPREFAPDHWGEAKLEEAVDSKGASLKSKDEERFGGRFGNFSQRMSGDDEDDDGAKGDSAREERHNITLSFQPPDWKVKEIAKVKGSLSLQYFGGSQVVKISNAIPAKWISDATKGNAFRRGTDATEKPISDPKLAELGLNLKVQMAMVQAGMMNLMLELGSDKAGISDAQVFDATGRPWPTYMQGIERGDEPSLTLVVAGKPEPPLSLAFVVSGGGRTVEVPILVEKIAVRGK
jgi:hypothetical protein